MSISGMAVRRSDGRRRTMAHTLLRDSGWVVCRNFQEIAVPSLDVLPLWAERGRLHPDDYLANGALEICLRANDVPELSAIFRRSRGARGAILGLLGLS
jgi:hypothetical protein